MTVKAYGGHLIVSRTDEQGANPRFRLTPLGQGAYGLSLQRRKRWEPLPFEGTLKEHRPAGSLHQVTVTLKSAPPEPLLATGVARLWLTP